VASDETQRYAHKIVCITGSSRGIGKRLALRFAAEGAHVVINYVRSGEAAREVARQVEEMGQEALVVRANMAQEERIAEMFDKIQERFGRLDVFIHNAASGRNRMALDVDAKGWDWTMNVNARAFLLGSQHAARLMPAEGGALLAISSFGSDHVFPYYTAVGASKAAIEATARYLAVELAPRKINANAIAAGAVETEALEHFPEIEKTWEVVKQRLPYERMVNADDVANLALFLCSKEAEMIRGQAIKLDGGITHIIP
jgi:enoyl-[acyl-carrier protein] reductase III